MSKKKQSTARKMKSQENSTIKFWVWSFENVEINQRNLILFFGFVIGTSIIAVALIYALTKLELFEYLLKLLVRLSHKKSTREA